MEYLNKPAVILLEMQNLFEIYVLLIDFFFIGIGVIA